MFKFVVLSVVLAVVAADPSAVWGAGLAAPLAAGWGAGVATPWAAGVASPWAVGVATPWGAPVGAVAASGPAHWIKKRSLVASPLAAGWGAGVANPWAAGVASPWAAGVATPWAAGVATPWAAPVGAVSVGGPAHWIKKRSLVAAPLVAAPLAATPLTWGRSWVGPAAPLAVAAPVAPWGLGLGARVGHLW